MSDNNKIFSRDWNSIKAGILKYGFLFYGGYIAVILYHQLNYVQMDFAGHLWSSVQFGRGLFQTYSDQIFLGYTHGLYYPPLEDFILLLIRTLSGGLLFESFRFYIIVLWVVYLFSVWFALKRMSDINVRLIVGLCFLFLFWINKPEGLHLQGLSSTDIIFNGLTSEFLGAIFFFIMLAKLADKQLKNWFSVSILLALVILSHIVVGLIAIAVVATYLFDRENRMRCMKVLSLAALLTAFSWLPFVLNLKFMVGGQIVKQAHWIEFAFAVITLMVVRKNTFGKSLAILAAAIFLINSVLFNFEAAQDHFFRFHYYRFVILADFILLYAIGIGASSKKISAAIAALFLGFLLLTEKPLLYDTQWPSLQATRIDFTNIGNLDLPGYGRYLIFGTDRSVDFGIDSILASKHPDFKSTKGIFWESSKTNTLQSSMLATLFAPPVVLNFFYYHDFDCNVQQLVLDQYLRYFNVKGVIINPHHMNQIDAAKATCYKNIITNGTDYSKFVQTGMFYVNREPTFVFKIEPKTMTLNPNYTTDVIELINPDQLNKFDLADKNYAQALRKIYEDAAILNQSKLQTWVDEKTYASILNEVPVVSGDNGLKILPDFKKLNQTQYQISIPSDQPKLFAVKLSPQPGMNLTDVTGKKLKLFESYPYILGIGQGEMTLSFERPPGAILSWLISICAFLFAVAYTIKKKPFIFRTQRE